MKIAALEASDFRNLEPVLLEPHPRFNVISGDNAQGKTNLLEALHLMGTLRSFRAGKLEEMVRFGRDQTRVRARVERQGVVSLLELEVRGGQKSARLDGKGVRSSTLSRGLTTVLFAPDDLQLVQGGPGARRRALDRAVWNAHPAYLGEAQRYDKVLRSRNALLREERPDAALLEVFDEQLAAAAAPIWTRRRQWVETMRERVTAAFASVMHGGPALAIRLEAEDQDLRGALKRDLARDLARGATSSGPHTDDLALALDDRPAAAFASQGQTRAVVLALKIAEIQFLTAHHGEAPVLLLDDVSSELDPTRNQHLFDFLEKVVCQVFVTTTHRDFVRISNDAVTRRDYTVQAGVITWKNT